MGLFNRGSRSDPEGPRRRSSDWSWDAEPDAPSSNGNQVDPWKVEAPAPPEPEVADVSPPPAPSEPPAAEPPAAESPAPVIPVPRVVEPPAPVASEPTRAPSPPPANRAEPEPDEAARLTAQQALAPSRGPAHLIPPAAAEPPERRAQVISFANQKGGVAKTTTTLNLAVAFAESGHDVLAIDLDPQGNLTMSQGIDPDRVERSMYDVLVHHIPLREVI